MSAAQSGKLTKVKTILISQPTPENDKNPYAELSKKLSVKIDFRSFTHVEGIPAREFRQSKVSIPAYTAIIFNSRNAIDHFFRMCTELKLEMPAETKYFCISDTIGNYVQKHIQMRKRKVFFGEGKLADLIPMMQKNKNEAFLLPISDTSNNDEFIAQALEAGVEVRQVVMFKTVSSDLSDLSDVKYDMLVFFTPTGIKSLYENFPTFTQGPTRMAAFGAATQKAIIDANLRLDIAAPAPGVPSMTMAIEEYVRKANNIK